MLHIVANNLENCLHIAQKNDVILLIEDAVYQAEQAATHTQQFTIFILKEDTLARGCQDKIAGLTSVDYAGFVKLTTQHHPILSW